MEVVFDRRGGTPLDRDEERTQVVTGEDGAFRLYSTAEGATGIRVQAPRFVVEELPLPTSSSDPLEIRLRRPGGNR